MLRSFALQIHLDPAILFPNQRATTQQCDILMLEPASFAHTPWKACRLHTCFIAGTWLQFNRWFAFSQTPVVRMSAAGALTGKRPALKPVSFLPPVTFSTWKRLLVAGAFFVDSEVTVCRSSSFRGLVWKDGGKFMIAARLL
jgi:hypothetical protein